MRKEKLEELHSYIEELKIIKRKLLEKNNNSYIKVKHYKCILNNGATIVRDKIIELVGDLSKIELFAREKVPGWDAWGNEIESDIRMEDYKIGGA